MLNDNHEPVGAMYCDGESIFIKNESGSGWSTGTISETLRQDVSTEMIIDTSTPSNSDYKGNKGNTRL